MNMEYKTAKRMECLPFSGIRAVMEKANKMQQAGEKIIHLEIGRPDFDTPEKIKNGSKREPCSRTCVLHIQLRYPETERGHCKMGEREPWYRL